MKLDDDESVKNDEMWNTYLLTVTIIDYVTISMGMGKTKIFQR